jgi:hypothetical protein
LQQQQGVNPFPDESNAANASLETTKLSVYIILGVVFVLFMGWAMRFKSSGGTGDMTIRGKTFNLKSVDFFFAEKHQTPENASYERMKPFSFSPVCLSALYHSSFSSASTSSATTGFHVFV